MGVIRRILKISGWIVASLLGFGIAAYLVVVAINWRDRGPSEAAIRLSTAHRDRPALADEDNAFIYVLGFAALPADDPQLVGSRRAAWIQRDLEVTSAASDPLGTPPDYREARHPALKEFIAACRSARPACDDPFAADDDILEQWIASERWLLERYRILISLPGWREILPYDISLTVQPFGLVMDGQWLSLANARMLAKKGDALAVRKLLEDDLRFWRNVLASSDLLISKMIATAALNRHFKWGNLVLRELARADAALAFPAAWEMPISDSERSMRRCMTGEWIFAAEHLRQENRISTNPLVAALIRPLYQPQHSINEIAAYYSQLADLLDAPLPDYQAALDRVRAAREQREERAWESRSPYNLIGNTLILLGSADFAPYGARVNDIEGVRRAALTAVRFRERNIPMSAIATALDTAPLRNPYDDRAFAWDADRGAIVFTGLQPGPRGEYRIRY